MQTRSIRFVLFFFISLFILGKAAGQTVDMVGPSGSGAYGTSVTVLPNGNYVVTDPYYSEGVVDSIGAVYLYNGSTNGLISVLKGSTAKDKIGSNGVTALNNNNFVVSSPNWNNGLVTKVGAVTWCSGISGLTGTVNPTNSLIGSSVNDSIGNLITALTNGNYVVGSIKWSGKKGAATWANGMAGRSGVVDISNSLVGSTAGDQVSGLNIYALPNGNYVVNNLYWNSNMGASTWGSGTAGVKGVVSAENSLVGSTVGDQVGFIVVLTNGNYVIRSRNWNNGRGAATWANGSTGITGVVSATNSLIGSNPGTVATGDQIGAGVRTLTNGNYIVSSTSWNGNMGSVTWCDGSIGLTGTVTASNSLVGSIANDQIGTGITALKNGNYIVCSMYWNGSKGAATWCDGSLQTTGTVNSGNSLTGSAVNDNVGLSAVALSNGNYVVSSYVWNNGQGAATWGNGSTGIKGVVSASNSLVGSPISGNIIGISFTQNIVALTNGNYVVGNPNWNGNTGASTLGNGTTGTSGNISANNSLLGSTVNDKVGYGITTALSNGSYVIASPYWNSNKGAATFGNGNAPIVGTITANNSMIGVSVSDNIGGFHDNVALVNGNYIMKGTNWDSGKGLITWGNGTGGTTGIPNNCNSVFGTASNGGNGGYYMNYAYDSTYNYLLVGRLSDNIVSRYYPSIGAASPSNNDNSSATISGNSPFVFPTTTGCGQIAALTPSGTNPVSGSVTAKTWLESPQPTYFVARHYEITPATNPSSSTGTITLYFTQADFDGFNNQSPAPAALLPTGPNDAGGKSHLLVEKQGGVSNVGTGLPGTYPGTVTTIDPADSNIVWNTALNRWEVTFDVTGFSGFFIKTAAATIVLPLQLLNFSGTRQGNNNLLKWTTSNEVGTKTFVVESSANGSSFAAIGNVTATGGGNYSYTDIKPIANRTYYRLKMMDIDGTFTYSGIEIITVVDKGLISIYPTPVRNQLTVVLSAEMQNVNLQLVNSLGQVLLINTTPNGNTRLLNMGNLPAGLYLLKVMNGTNVVTTQKVVKE